MIIYLYNYFVLLPQILSHSSLFLDPKHDDGKIFDGYCACWFFSSYALEFSTLVTQHLSQIHLSFTRIESALPLVRETFIALPISWTIQQESIKNVCVNERWIRQLPRTLRLAVASSPACQWGATIHASHTLAIDQPLQCAVMQLTGMS